MTTNSTLNAEQEALWYHGSLKLIQAIGEQSGHAVLLTEHILPAGAQIYANHHQDKDEGVYVTVGEAIFSCGEQVINVTAGTLLVLPQNVHHHLEISTSGPFRYLTWTMTTGFAHNALHMGKPGQALALSPPPVTAQDRIQQLAILLRKATTSSPEDYRALLELGTFLAFDF